jgi:rhodanese-related sulfurtransferase
LNTRPELEQAIVFPVPSFLQRRRKRPAVESVFVDADTLKNYLAEKDGLIVLDVRGADEMKGPLGHVAGARNIAVADLSNHLDSFQAEKDKPIVIVCLTEKRSLKAEQILGQAGFTDLSVLRGGMEAWNSKGYPVER